MNQEFAAEAVTGYDDSDGGDDGVGRCEEGASASETAGSSQEKDTEKEEEEVAAASAAASASASATLRRLKKRKLAPEAVRDRLNRQREQKAVAEEVKGHSAKHEQAIRSGAHCRQVQHRRQ